MRSPDFAATAQYIAWHVRHSPDAAAIVENEAFISYATLAADLVRCVRALEALGVRPEMLAGVEHPSRYQHLLILLACEIIGAASTSLTPGQDDAITRHCDIVLTNSTPPAPGVAITDAELSVLERPVVPERMARIVRTSGTSGEPKAIPMTFATQQLRIVRTIADLPPNIPRRQRLLCMYHLATGPIHRRVLTALQLGGTVLFTLARHAWPLIAAGAVDYAAFAVGDLERSIGEATPPPPGHPLHLMLFGAAVPRELRQQVRDRLHASVENSYASNETNLIAMMDDDNVGTLCEGMRVRIVDDTGREVPAGEAGIIRVQSETVVSGYFNDPGLTAASFIDGWFQTSDIGVMPEPGRLIVLGRADDMLNIGGVKVPPAPIEDQLKRIDGVSDAAVMSIASMNAAGGLLAAIEIGGGRPPAELRRCVGAIISKYVGNFEIMVLPSLPRTESGKIKRPEIEAAFRRRHSQP